MKLTKILGVSAVSLTAAVAATSWSEAQSVSASGKAQTNMNFTPKFSNSVAFDTSPTLRDLASMAKSRLAPGEDLDAILEVRPEWGLEIPDRGHSPDRALQLQYASKVPSVQLNGGLEPLQTFEGLSNQDNASVLGFRVAPPDPVGDVGPDHYVEMINLVFGIYDKQGNLLLGPVDTGALWAGFPVTDCTEPSGDPIVVYDQFVDRWLLSQFTTSGLSDPTKPFWNCVAISVTGDPTGAYYRYAFETENFQFFPDYPKYGVWRDSYVITTREFGPVGEYGIGVYALDKNKMVNGQPASAVSFFIDGIANSFELLPLIGDGLLPADIDGKQKPKNGSTIPLVGTQDDDASYGATFDAINIWDLYVQWKAIPSASLVLATQLPVAAFDSIFPCPGNSRDCLPQPGVAVPSYLDVQSYRQRAIWRLAYRNFKDYETLVTNQSVEALPGIAGVRWYEIRRTGDTYSLYQQGTYAPNDGIHRWMGSVAQDRNGNIAAGFSVVNGVDVYPGIRYTARLAGDPLGMMTLGEGTIIDGSGSQLTTSSRWGDYSSMNIDPVDDCTFWYVQEYYEITELAAFQTRVASFKLPDCEAPED